jgi:Na+/phosphate symporter
MIIYLSLLVAIVGVLMYALAANPKLSEIGRLAFFAGLLAFLLESLPRMVGVVK